MGDATAEAIRVSLRRVGLVTELEAAMAWAGLVDELIGSALLEQRWIATELIDQLALRSPSLVAIARLETGEREGLISADERRAIAVVERGVHAIAAETNERIMAAELTSQREFFDTIEKSPLTDEQARAVVCFDNRVQVLAAAGSGKTSVMVARAAYAVRREFVAPERILVLAFNKNAAAELQERITARFDAAGIDGAGVRASTFHAFGLEVIGAATGKKPRAAAWLDRDVDMVLKIVDDLRDRSTQFRYRWDLYRLLFADTSIDVNDTSDPDGYNSDTAESGYTTFAGEVVRSHGERLIANFLFLNSVTYAYEQPYVHDVADATHSQYRPDFYYPTVDVWHEHWATGRDGLPPGEFVGYAEGMEWKRATHESFDTTLIESTFDDVVNGDGLEQLQRDLEALGVTFDWNPERPVQDRWVRPVEHKDLARTVRTFMSHVKSNSLTAATINERLRSDCPHLAGFRSKLFLELYWQIHSEWEQRLAADHAVDFDDMLITAAELLENGDVDMPYDLVMVDEFQDASQARARLVRALLQQPRRYLLAVGDDWQSINRFAGADITVMTQFDEWFGHSQQLALTTTFRCPQTICDVASTFVTKNPAQFRKQMRSAHPDSGPPVTIIHTSDPATALTRYLTDLNNQVANGTIPPGRDGKVNVYVLGRYGFQRDLLRVAPSHLDVTFRTVHGSKGLEADYVAIPDLSRGTYGFPSRIADDPILALATPTPENFEHAEERRLLYVALTRARRAATLITPANKPSPFIAELLGDPNVIARTDGGEQTAVRVCSRCHEGVLVPRGGRYGPFLGCSRFPACTSTEQIT